jgi:hypothetical protein
MKNSEFCKPKPDLIDGKIKKLNFCFNYDEIFEILAVFAWTRRTRQIVFDESLDNVCKLQYFIAFVLAS